MILHWVESPQGTWCATLSDKRTVIIHEVGHALRVTLRSPSGGIIKIVSSFDTLAKTKRLAARLVSTTGDV